MIFELALLRYFKDELLSTDRRAGKVAATQSLTGPELAAAAAGGMDDRLGGMDEIDMTTAAAPAAPAAPAKLLKFGGKKAIYLAPLKSVKPPLAGTRASTGNAQNPFSHPLSLVVCRLLLLCSGLCAMVSHARGARPSLFSSFLCLTSCLSLPSYGSCVCPQSASKIGCIV